jgi:hypothetical protein
VLSSPTPITEAIPVTSTAAPPTSVTSPDLTTSPTVAMGGVPGSSNQGNDFYVLETPTFTCGKNSFAIAVANPSDEPANVVIENPGSSTSTSITIPAGNLTNTRFSFWLLKPKATVSAFVLSTAFDQTSMWLHMLLLSTVPIVMHHCYFLFRL